MTKAFKLNWHRDVPAELTGGTSVDRWTEVRKWPSESPFVVTFSATIHEPPAVLIEILRKCSDVKVYFVKKFSF